MLLFASTQVTNCRKRFGKENTARYMEVAEVQRVNMTYVCKL